MKKCTLFLLLLSQVLFARNPLIKPNYFDAFPVIPSGGQVCDYCEYDPQGNGSPVHTISLNQAAQYIYNFNSSPLSTGIINSGITLVFNEAEFNDLEKGNASLHQKMKMHWCLEPNGRLSLSADLQTLCTEAEGRFTTNEAINTNGETGSDNRNDIPRQNWNNPEEVISHLNQYSTLNFNAPVRLQAANIQAMHETFSAHAIHNYYGCDAAYFDKKNSVDNIRSFHQTNIFRVYFGYNPNASEVHKLLIILVGVDPATKRNMTEDSGHKSLMREFSRPRP